MSYSNPMASEILRLQEASVWIQKLNASNDPALTADWMEWCRSDSLNLTAFERMQEVWDGFSAAEQEAYSPRASTASMRRTSLIGLAAGALLVLCVAGWFELLEHAGPPRLRHSANADLRHRILVPGPYI